MDEFQFDHDEISKLINSAWDGDKADGEKTALRQKFEERLERLSINPTQAVDNLKIEFRTLYGILDGTLKRLDILSVLKIAQFLEIPYNEIMELYANAVADKNKEELTRSKKRTFILNTFDLHSLKTIGIINSIRDFDHIESQLNLIFGLSSILDFDTEEIGAAHSETKVKPKNNKNRIYFKSKSKLIFRLINNPHRFDKQALIDYFPKIRWHSTDLDGGLVNVIRALYELGVTVIFQPSLPSLQMRGATFEVNGKPCIVLTNFRASYPTLWFALLHELFHVMFDWEEILLKRYHFSDEENDLFVLRHKEEEANEFAREYLFPSPKLEIINNKIRHRVIVKEFASDNHVHESIIYANYAFRNSTDDNNLWAQFDKLIRPQMDTLIKKLSNSLTHKSPALDFAKYYSEKIYNFK
jgi:HTH-type transcriptional regulator/antitoxin HigA